jgi:D-alanine-D-alanine ligase
VAEGTGKGITERSFIRTAAELQQTVGEMLATCRQPVLVEEYLPGDEFTVGVIGTGASARVVGVMQIHYRSEVKQIYSYATKKDYEERVDYSLVKPGPVYDACVAVVLRAWRTLDCRDGGRVDLRMDAAGVPNFIEVNPLAGLNPTHSDLPILCRLGGTSYVQLIGMIMESALTRLPVAAPI